VTRFPVWPPGPVLRSLVGTLLVTYALAVALSLMAGIWVTTVQSIVWRLGFVFGLLWIEIHRQSFRMFLANLGVSRRRTLGGLLGVYLLVEASLHVGSAWVAEW
jgi:hypothetical protein